MNTLDLTQKPDYLDWENLQGRARLLMCMWDGSEWHAWAPHPAGTGFLRLKPVDAAEIDYLAKAPARSSDVHLRWLEFMFQRAYYPDLAHFIDGVTTDVRSLAASLAKVDFFFEHRTAAGFGVARFVETEVEYIVGVCRSMYDLLYEVFLRIWADVQLIDASAVKCQLPRKLSKLVLRGERAATAEEIARDHCLPPMLAGFWSHSAPFFRELRKYRDLIQHKGHDAPRVLVTERGFAIEADSAPFSTFDCWNDTHRYGDRYVSLRPALAHTIRNTLFTFETFEASMKRTIVFPPEVAPGYHVFVRGAHTLSDPLIV